MAEFTLTRREKFDCDSERLFEAVSQPARQAEWNSLYASVDQHQPIALRDEVSFRGVFKGFGAVEVAFADVEPTAFTHLAPLKVAGLSLGTFRHRYAVEPAAPAGAYLTQTVTVATRGLGVLMTGVMKNGFGVRMPESFLELRAYLDRRQAAAA